MDILEKKQKGEFDNELKKIIKILKFGNSPIELKGSSSLKSQKYYSDYDLFSSIDLNYGMEYIYDEFRKILNNIISSENLYFIEMKIQTTKGKKYRYFPNDDFNYNDFKKKFKNVDFVKIDLISRIDNIFIEVSSIYKFSEDPMTTEQYKKNIYDDIKELKKEKNFYKILKRMFNIYKVENDLHKMNMLTKIFNGEMGEQYKKITNLEAINNLKKYYDDPKTKKKIEINLLDIKEPLNNYNQNLQKYKNNLNEKAKKIYSQL